MSMRSEACNWNLLIFGLTRLSDHRELFDCHKIIFYYLFRCFVVRLKTRLPVFIFISLSLCVPVNALMIINYRVNHFVWQIFFNCQCRSLSWFYIEQTETTQERRKQSHIELKERHSTLIIFNIYLGKWIPIASGIDGWFIAPNLIQYRFRLCNSLSIEVSSSLKGRLTIVTRWSPFVLHTQSEDKRWQCPLRSFKKIAFSPFASLLSGMKCVRKHPLYKL